MQSRLPSGPSVPPENYGLPSACVTKRRPCMRPPLSGTPWRNGCEPRIPAQLACSEAQVREKCYDRVFPSIRAFPHLGRVRVSQLPAHGPACIFFG